MVTSPQLRSFTDVDLKVYEGFRTWRGARPPGTSDAFRDLEGYWEVLAAEEGPEKATATIGFLAANGRRLEAARWDKRLVAGKKFNKTPNAFLRRCLSGLTRGRALDVGMGQGRNALYLARVGWEVTGFDPAGAAVAMAAAAAAAADIRADFRVGDVEDFDFGHGCWDLVVLSYVGARSFARRVVEGLRVGGAVVVEAFHEEALRSGPIGSDVVFADNELLVLFGRLRTRYYEDTVAKPDFGTVKRQAVVRYMGTKV